MFVNLAGNIMMTDPIADMLTRMRNALMTKKREVVIPYSQLKYRVAEILRDHGYIADVQKQEGAPAPHLVIGLKYRADGPAIQSIMRESTPGRRVYRRSIELPKVLNGYGIAVVSTSQGIMTAEEARKRGIGGEVMCSVY